MFRIFHIGLLLAGACCLSSAAVDSSLLAMAPVNSQVVAAININDSRNSAFGQFLLRQLNVQDDSFQQFIEQTGFDPRRDLQAILFTAAQLQNARTHGRFAVLARGNFDQSRIKAAAQKRGSVVQQFQGVDLLVGSQGNNQTTFAFTDIDLVVMGDLLSVKQVIRNRGNPTSLDPALQEQISKVEGNDAWFASTLLPPSLTANVDPDLKQPMDHAQVLRSIVRSSGGIQFGSTSDITFNAVTRSTQDATALADVIRFMASMVQMQRGKDGRADLLAPALDGMQLEVAGSTVHVALHLPESVLEQLAGFPEKAARSTR
jgi:hypothetical protein